MERACGLGVLLAVSVTCSAGSDAWPEEPPAAQLRPAGPDPTLMALQAVRSLREDLARAEARLRHLEQVHHPVSITLRTINLDQSGTTTCAAYGESCVAVAGRKVTSPTGRLCGYLMPTCDALLRHRSRCTRGHTSAGGGYRFDDAVFRAGVRSDQRCPAIDPRCLATPFYEAAICVGRGTGMHRPR